MRASLSRAIADFAADLNWADVPKEVQEKAGACLLNGYGIGIGCYNTPYAPVARRAAIDMDGQLETGATMLGDGRRTSIGGAVLANAALFHGRAQEDACGAAHLGAILIPLLTALVESGRYPSTRFLEALVAGYEAGGILEEAFARDTTPAGFRASTLYGSIAAATAAGKLMGLSGERLAAAIANAASFSGGILQSFADGTDEWRYQVGATARAGWLAAELAKAGSVSAPHALDGPKGLIGVFARAEFDQEALTGALGQSWQTLRVAFKPFPVCAFNQTPVTAALELRRRLNGAGIASGRVRMNPYETGYAGMDSFGPFSSVSGTLMSIPFCIAATLLRGTPTMKMMTTYDDPEINALIPNIELVTDDAVPTLSCIIELNTVDGHQFLLDQKMTAKDYSYSWDQVSLMVRRIGEEEGVPAQAYDIIEEFSANPVNVSVARIVTAFSFAEKLN